LVKGLWNDAYTSVIQQLNDMLRHDEGICLIFHIDLND